MTIYSHLMIISWEVFSYALFFGYGICHFLITPFLLKKHRNMPFVKTMISEGRLAEFHLKNLIKETDDKSAKWTLAAIHYSKFIIIISLISGIVFAVIQAN